jgi:RNA recognition motif-containing protein
MKIHVCNINWNSTEDQFREWLTEVQGYVFSSCQMIMSGETGKPRGFAFLTFETEEAAREALRDLEGEEYMGRPLHASLATPKPRSGDEKRRSRVVRRPADSRPVMGSRYGDNDDIDWGDK